MGGRRDIIKSVKKKRRFRAELGSGRETGVIFTSEWWYCGVIELAIVAAIVAAAVLLAGKRPLLDRAVTMVIGAYLIMYMSYELLPELLPADLSAVSYFVFAAAAFFLVKKGKIRLKHTLIAVGVIFAAMLGAAAFGFVCRIIKKIL